MLSPEDTRIPGTVQLTDADGSIDAKHAGNTDIILIPVPTNDPEDPLNWTPRRKALSTFCTLLYTGLIAGAFGSTPTVLVQISNSTGLTINDLVVGVGYTFLTFGWGCLIWQPLAMQYGKRPMYLISILVTVALMAWTPYCKSNAQWIANKLLQGFFGAPVESLSEISLTDLYFQHERGKYIAYYGMVLFSAIYVMTIIAGFIADGQGWPWVLFWASIFCAVGFVFLFFLMEETNYEVRGSNVGGAAASVEVNNESLEGPATSNSDPEKTPWVTRATPDSVPQIYPRKSYFDKLKLWRTADLKKENRILGMMLRPIVFFTYPVILYAGFSYGAGVIWFNVIINTVSPYLTAPPYNFSTSLAGLSYLSVLLGTILAFPLCGSFGDKFCLWMARRNGGVAEPEHRLWLNLAPLVLVPFSLILWGVGSEHGIHWFGCIVALFLLGISITFLLQLNIGYCLDSYKDLSAEALVTVICIRNTMNFAFDYGFTPWLTSMGRQNAFITAAMVGLAQIATFLLMIKYGKTLRKLSVQRYYKHSAILRAAGLIR
ncbi:uncharacterized protein Z519_07743 [Cladophialophora bantiana CBS 173.52]|uniref:Major facilitator superfamily (MFS) profile domain-containing protein n=1 Tax=Cladophialophora bantiana (strain ATCC 10958 / CBS 173.52 / CDC B-1940 / NIH 8579) TaxID=1442370 RepID=A0A0D2HER6_CLAB1|nr:uncharacterized protein Z519_07743 [Cladophialophora bantiana CBS 173.52]KIW91773.1 hypothetical protein Z519_07743 [Cladophialophora bantiana CBS 173.52]